MIGHRGSGGAQKVCFDLREWNSSTNGESNSSIYKESGSKIQGNYSKQKGLEPVFTREI